MNNSAQHALERPLNTLEAAELLGLSASFLNSKRVTGGGPPFVKLGRKVAYRMVDLQTWLAERVRASTSETV